MVVRALAIVALSVPSLGHAQGVSGYGELIVTGQVGVEGVPVQVVERFRPELQAELHERWLLVGAVEASLSQGRDVQSELQRTLEESDFGPLLEGCTWPGDDNEALGISRVSDYLFVDRLYLDAYLPAVDLRLGRQAVQWGSARFFNPTDPFPEVLLTEPWRNRKGVNAVSATVPLGGMNNRVDLLVGADDLFLHPRLAAKGTVNVAMTDLSLVGAYRGEVDGGFVGVDVRGTLGVGFWLEAALHAQPLVEGGDPEAWEEIAVGIDYSLPVLDSLLLTAQYYRNGRGDPAGTGVPGGAFTAALEPPDCDGASPFPAAEEPDPFAPFVRKSNYGLLAANLAISPAWSVSASALHGFDDHTGIAIPAATWRPTGALELVLHVQVPYDAAGDGGEFRPAEEDLVIEAPVGDASVDLSGLVPSAVAILWARASF